MSITSILVVFAVMWFLTLFVVLPIGERSQEEEGDVVPGTPAGAPAEPRMKRKVIITTIWATVLTAVICGVVLSGLITVDMIDVRGVN